MTGHLLAGALALAATLAATATEACERVRFSPGAVSGSAVGAASFGRPACFVLGVSPGQRFRVEVLEGDPALSVNGAPFVYGQWVGYTDRPDMVVEAHVPRDWGRHRFRLLFTIL